MGVWGGWVGTAANTTKTILKEHGGLDVWSVLLYDLLYIVGEVGGWVGGWVTYVHAVLLLLLLLLPLLLFYYYYYYSYYYCCGLLYTDVCTAVHCGRVGGWVGRCTCTY